MGTDQCALDGLDNPLELTAALLFVAISLLSSWVRSAYGSGGVDVLVAIVGVAEYRSIAAFGGSPTFRLLEK